MDRNPQASVQDEIRMAQEDYRAGRLDTAESRINQLHARFPQDADILTAKGMVQIGRGNQEGALESFLEAIKFAPNAGETIAWAAYVCLNLRRPAQAEELAKKLTYVSPNNPRAYFLLANAFRGQNKYEEALSAIDRSLALKADDPEALITKARVLKSLRMPGLAFEFFRQAYAISPTLPAAVELATKMLHESHPEEALDVLDGVDPSTPSSNLPYALYAEAYAMMGRLDEASENWVLAKRYSRDQVGLAQAQAKVEIASGRFEVAEQLLVDLIDQSLDVPTSFMILTTARKMKADDLQLIEQMERTLARGELSPLQKIDLAYGLGKSFDDLKEPEKAMRYFDEANRTCFELYPQRKGFDRARYSALIDFLIHHFTADRVKTLAQEGISTDLPIFVVGMMRSGTTLTEGILSAHSKVFGVGEQSFWTERATEFLYSESGKFHYDHMMVMEFATDYMQFISPRQDGILHVVDKNPANIDLAGSLLGAFSGAKMVHLKRHPVDNLISLWMTPVSANVGYASDKSNLVFAYRQYMRLWKHWQDVLPADRFSTYRYEDLTSESEATIGSMLDFLGLEHEAACFAPETNIRTVQTPSVLQVRQPIHRGSQARWKNYEPWLGEFAELLDEA